MRYKIYSKDGVSVRCETEKLEYNGQFMGENSVIVSAKSPKHIDFNIDDYVVFRGENFYLANIPTEKKTGDRNTKGDVFQYDNMKFMSVQYELNNADFNDFVGDTQTDISFTAQPNFSFVAKTIDDLLQRIQVNMNRYYTGDKQWTLKTSDSYTTDSDYQNMLITVSNISCWDALALVNSKYGVNFIIRGRTVTVGTNGSIKDITFKVGAYKGLWDMTRNSQTDQGIVTKLTSYGNTTNIHPRYYSLISATVTGKVTNAVYKTSDIGDGNKYTRLFLTFDLLHSTELNENITISMKGKSSTYDTLTLKWETSVEGVTGYALYENYTVADDLYAGMSVGTDGTPTANNSVTFKTGVRKDNISDLSHLSFDVNSKLPNNMNIMNLMLPAFPTQTLAEWVEENKSKYSWLQEYVNQGYTFSTERFYPCIYSKNKDVLGIRPHTEYFTSEDETHKDIYPSLQYFQDDRNQVVGATTLNGGTISDSGVFVEGATVDPIYIIIPDLGFDFNDVVTSKNSFTLHFNSGYCGGRDFTVSSWEKSGTTWKLKCARIKDDSIGKYFPYKDAPIQKGDKFVITDIYMPDTYIEQASIELLKWTLKWLAKNDYSVFSYQLTPDINFIKRHDDAINDKTTTFHQTVREGDILLIDDTDMGVSGSITIDQIKITEGDGLLPKYEITLRDTKTVGTIQKVQQQIDTLTGGGGSAGYSSSQIGEIAYASLKDKFISKIANDKTIYKDEFGEIVVDGKSTVQGDSETDGMNYSKGGITIGTFSSGLLGSGALIDSKGNAEVESIASRTFMSAKSFVYNLVECNVGERWSTNGFCKVKSVDTIKQIITEELDADEYSTMQVGDICRGTFSDIDSQYTTSDSNADDCGFPTRKGFFTSYFYVAKVISSEKGKCTFQYGLRNSSTPHPCALMTCAQYGNLTDDKRRASIYQCNYPHAFTINLEGVSTFEIRSENKVKIDGWLGDISVTLKNGSTKTLSGNGLYVQDNVFFGNAIVQLDPSTLKDLQSDLNNYIVDLDCNADVINVDAGGDVIGGLWSEEQNADKTETYKKYLIHSAIYVKNNNDILLLADDSADAGTGTYKVYLQCDGCTAELHNSTIYVTSITNVGDGVTTITKSDDWYTAMRKIDHISVTAIVDCEGKGTVSKTLNLPIKHTADLPVTADLDNEIINVVWNAATKTYIGLPATTNFSLYYGSERIWCTVAYSNIDGLTLTDDDNDDNSTKITISQNTSNPVEIPATSIIPIFGNIYIHGIPYERKAYLTINKRTDNTVYDLQPSVSIIHVKNSNGTLTYQTTSMTCGVIARTAETAPTSISSLPTGYSMTYTIDGGSAQTYTLGASIDVSTVKNKIRFTLLANSTTYDMEDVPVVSDGSDGKNGTSVTIKGNLTSTSELPTSGAASGDSYLISSDLWVYTATTTTDATHINGFTNVGQIKGDKGDSATQYYIYYAWANSANGQTDFTTSKDSTKQYAYIGVFVSTATTASQTYSDYTWNMCKGDTGNGIASTTIKYAQITSSAAPATTSTDWSTTKPDIKKGYYLHIWTRYTYTDGTTKDSYSVSYTGTDGTSIKGDKGNNVWFRTSEWQANTEYFDGATSTTINGVTMYPLDYISVTDVANSTAKYYYCKTHHTSGTTFDAMNWTEMSQLNALYAPLAWFDKAFAQYLSVKNLTAQYIVCTNSNGLIVRTINENGNGLDCYYYPDTKDSNGNYVQKKLSQQAFVYNSDGTCIGMKTTYYNADGSVSYIVNESGTRETETASWGSEQVFSSESASDADAISTDTLTPNNYRSVFVTNVSGQETFNGFTVVKSTAIPHGDTYAAHSSEGFTGYVYGLNAKVMSTDANGNPKYQRRYTQYTNGYEVANGWINCLNI